MEGRNKKDCLTNIYIEPFCVDEKWHSRSSWSPIAVEISVKLQILLSNYL
jgi:hypothetical protein